MSFQKYLNTIILIPILFFLFGVYTLPDYGINWDTINHLPRGQSYLHFFLTGNTDFNDLPKYTPYYQKVDDLFYNPDIKNLPRVSLYQDAGVDYSYFLEMDGGHPPLSDILSSVFNLVLFQKLGLIGDIDSYRIYGILLAACLVGLVGWWLKSRYGVLASIFGMLFLASYPLFWSEMHFNTEKDVPETVYWSFLLFSFWYGINKKSARWIILSGIFGGLALGTKFNVLFIVFIILPWLVFYFFINRKDYLSKSIILSNKNLYASIIIAPIISVLIFFFFWPYLWNDPVSNIQNVFKFYKDIGLTDNFDQRYITFWGLNTFPIKWIIFTTPIPLIILSIVGILYLLKNIFRDKTGFNALLLLWLVLPIARITMPGTTVYGGIRQIMEYIPALVMVAAVGVYWLFLSIDYPMKIWKRRVLIVILALCFTFNVVNLYKIHPNENVYFNSLIGGLSGAKQNELPFWGNTFGSAYRVGVAWINRHAPKNAKVAYARELIPNIPKNWFRRDIIMHNANRSGYLRKGEYIISLNYQGTENTSYFDRYLNRMLVPVYQEKVDGVPVLNIWKNDIEHSLPQFLKDQELLEFEQKRSAIDVQFLLPRVVSLSRLEAQLSQNCTVSTMGYVQISLDGINWERYPGAMPNEDWSVPQFKGQPTKDSLLIPFAADKAKYIQIISNPDNSCLSNLHNVKIYFFNSD